MDGIPHSTLANIAKTGIVPKKWRHRFAGVGAVDDRPRISIHKENMESAAATIVKHIKPSSRIGELIALLQEKLKEKYQETYWLRAKRRRIITKNGFDASSGVRFSELLARVRFYK